MLKIYLYILTLFSFNTLFGQIIINSRIVNENGEGIKNVIVNNLNSNKVITTDSSGYFNLNISSENVIIRFSHIGYDTKEFLTSNIPKVITLKDNITQLEEIEVNVSLNDNSRIVNNIINNYNMNHSHDSILYSVFYRGEPEEWYPNKAQNIFEMCLTMYSEKGRFTGKVDSLRVKNILNIDKSKIKITDLDYFNMLKSLTKAFDFDKSKHILSKDNPSFFKNINKLDSYSILSADIENYGSVETYRVILKNNTTNKELILYVDKNDYGIYLIKYDKIISFFLKKEGKYYRKGHSSPKSFSYFINAEKFNSNSNWVPNLKPGIKYNNYLTDWKSHYWLGLDHHKLLYILNNLTKIL